MKITLELEVDRQDGMNRSKSAVAEAIVEEAGLDGLSVDVEDSTFEVEGVVILDG